MKEDEETVEWRARANRLSAARAKIERWMYDASVRIANGESPEDASQVVMDEVAEALAETMASKKEKERAEEAKEEANSLRISLEAEQLRADDLEKGLKAAKAQLDIARVELDIAKRDAPRCGTAQEGTRRDASVLGPIQHHHEESMILTAIDPGVCTGWAVFIGGQLQSAGVATNPDDVPLPGGTAIIEQPQVYRGSKQKGDPNDLLKLAILVGVYKEKAQRIGARVELTTPHKWKGNVPKDIHNERTLARLTEYERAKLPALPKTQAHNMIDAIGLGLWFLEKEKAR